MHMIHKSRRIDSTQNQYEALLMTFDSSLTPFLKFKMGPPDELNFGFEWTCVLYYVVNNMPVESVLARQGCVEGHLLTSGFRGIEGMIVDAKLLDSLKEICECGGEILIKPFTLLIGSIVFRK